jgi:hypothetical protein
MQREAEALLAYVKENFPVGRTIAHGESIGVRRVFLPVVVVRTRWRLAGPDFLCCQGLVACHLAAEGLVDFVVAGAW